MTGLWHPDGWRHLGLWSPDVSAAAPSSPSEVRDVIIQVERRSGTPSFKVYGMGRLSNDAALEVSHTYLGLRRRYPGVFVDYLEFSKFPDDTLGTSVLYPLHMPALHSAAVKLWRRDGLVPTAGTVVSGLDSELDQDALAESSWLPAYDSRSNIDLSCAGAMSLSACLGHRSRYLDMHRSWDKLRSTAIRNGTTTWLPELRTSIASCVVSHEFGHLLEAAIWDFDRDLAYSVYAEISAELFNLDSLPGCARWRSNLLNYPTFLFEPGPVSGSGPRRNMLRSLARRDIGWRLGRYAIRSREELFAEVFMLATTGSDRGLQKLFVNRIRPLLAEAGLARR